MYNVITIGDAIIDTHVMIDNASVECDINKSNCKLCLNYAQKIPITDSFQSVGGNAANVAIGIKKLGLNSDILTSVGNDSNGKIVLEQLKHHGVPSDLVFTDEKSKTRYGIALNFKGERTILSYHQKRKYVFPEEMPETDWIYYSSLSDGFEDLQNKLVSFLKKHASIRLAFNPGSFQLKNSLNLVKEILPSVNLLIVNLEEAERIIGSTIQKEKGVVAILHKLLFTGAREVVITDGAGGAWAGNEEEIWYLKSFPVDVVSKTGAGDAFSSGYLAARINGHDLSAALSWGIANSCAVIGQVGAQKGLLDQKGIKKMISKFSSIKPKKVF
ncbi:MAG: carbohydrate kinase family protein [Patescibacteria group bacterium]